MLRSIIKVAVAGSLTALLALAGCSGNDTPEPSATPLGSKGTMTVDAADLPTIIPGDEGAAPTITYPLKPGASSPTPTPTENPDESAAAEPAPDESAPAEAAESGSPTASASASKEPSPYVDPPKSMQVQVLGTEGTGETVTESDIVSVSFIAWSWGVLEPLYGLNTFTTEDPFVFGLQTGSAAITALSRAVVGQKVGSRVMAVVPPSEGNLNESVGAKAGETVVVVMDIAQKFSKKLEADPSAKPTDAKTGPVITGELGAKATIKVPGGIQPPDKITLEPIAVGTGAKLEVGQTVLIHYASINWNGDDALSTWTGGEGPVSVVLRDNTLETITPFDLLVGQTVGSRVLITTPAKERAYAAQAVVVDIVAIVDPLPGSSKAKAAAESDQPSPSPEASADPSTEASADASTEASTEPTPSPSP